MLQKVRVNKLKSISADLPSMVMRTGIDNNYYLKGNNVSDAF